MRSIVVLFAAMAAVAWMSELLVGAVEHTAEAFGMTDVFVGVILVTIIGNAAEHRYDDALRLYSGLYAGML